MLHPFTRNLLAAALCGAAGLASAQASQGLISGRSTEP